VHRAWKAETAEDGAGTPFEIVAPAPGEQLADLAVARREPVEPLAVGGAAGWVGGLGAFGGFAIPPIMGAFVRAQGAPGYATGFVVYVVLALISLTLAYVLQRHHGRGTLQAA
jgi:NNP family nitrate/nitrite transporter-like MFS transporter